MTDAPNLITSSGREGLPLYDRQALLRADVIWLRANRDPRALAPTGREWTPAAARAFYATPTGASCHDFVNMLSWVDLISRALVPLLSSEQMSRAECLVMAWRRGGHDELRRVKNASIPSGVG